MSDINFGEAFVTVTPDFDGTAGRGAFAARLQDGLNTAFATIKTSILDSIGENIGQVVVDATKRFVGEFNTMETALREVLTLGAGQGAFQSQFDELQEQVTQFNLEAGKLSEETIPAVYNAISAGVPQDNVFEFLETANIAATAGVAELDASVAVLSAVSNAYADVGLTAAEASDILFQTVKGGVTNFSLLADNLGKVTPIAAAVGVQLEEVAGGLALLTKVGIDTATATTQIRAALVELSNPASQVATIFTELSGGTFQAFTEGGGTLVDALKLLTVQADQTGIAVQDMFSSVEAKTAITAFASDIDGLQNAIGEAANSAGATGEAYEIMSGSVEFAIKRLDALRESVGEVIGANLQDNVRDLTNLLVDLGPTLIAIADTLSAGLGQTTRLIVIPALKALTPPLKLLGTILEQIPEEVVALTAAWLALNSAFRFNPINALTSNLGLLTARLGSTTVASRALGTSLGQNLAKQAAAGTGAMGTLNKVTTSVGKSLPLIGIAAVGVSLAFSRWRKRQAELAAEAQELVERLDDQTRSSKAAAAEFAELAAQLRELRGETEAADVGFEGFEDSATLSGIALRDALFDQSEGALEIIKSFGVELNDETAVLIQAANQGFEDLNNAYLNANNFSDPQEFFRTGADQALQDLLDSGASEEVAANFQQISDALVVAVEQNGFYDQSIQDVIDALDDGGDAAGRAQEKAGDLGEEQLKQLLISEDLSQAEYDLALARAEATNAVIPQRAALEDLVELKRIEVFATEEGIDVDLDRVASNKALRSGYLELIEATEANVEVTEEAQLAYEEMQEAVLDVSGAVDDLTESYRSQFDLALGIEEFTNAYLESLGTVKEALDEIAAEDGGGITAFTDDDVRTLNQYSDVGRDARQVVIDQTEAILDLAEARLEDGQSIASVNDFLTAALETQRQEFIDAGVEAAAYDETVSNLRVPTDLGGELDASGLILELGEIVNAAESAEAQAAAIDTAFSGIFANLADNNVDSADFVTELRAAFEAAEEELSADPDFALQLDLEIMALELAEPGAIDAALGSVGANGTATLDYEVNEEQAITDLEAVQLKLEALGEDVSPTINLDDEQALADMEELDRQLANIARNRIVTVTVQADLSSVGAFGLPNLGAPQADGSIIDEFGIYPIGETGDREVVINTEGSSLQRQYELARDSGLIDNLVEYGTQQQGDGGGALSRLGGSGGGGNVIINAARYDEVLLADLASRLLERT